MDPSRLAVEEDVLTERPGDTEMQKFDHRDADAALEFLNQEATGSMTEVDEKKLLKKIDWRIVPLMCKLGASW